MKRGKNPEITVAGKPTEALLALLDEVARDVKPVVRWGLNGRLYEADMLAVEKTEDGYEIFCGQAREVSSSDVVSRNAADARDREQRVRHRRDAP